MNFTFPHLRMSHLVVSVPAHTVRFEDELSQYAASEKSSRKLAKVMGYDRHRIVRNRHTSGADMAVHALERLRDAHGVDLNDADALLYVTQSPDHPIPPSSLILQGRLGLHREMLCLDLPQGCAGWTLGMLQAGVLLSQPGIRRVLLVSGEVSSKQLSPHDRSGFPLAGDGAAAALLEAPADAPPAYGISRMDGSAWQTIHIPCGGYRDPARPDGFAWEEDAEGNRRQAYHIHSDGSAIYNFVMEEVPRLVTDTLALAQTRREDIDRFLFHQPNPFILRNLADKMGVPLEKLPHETVCAFGNASAVALPTTLVTADREELLRSSRKVCLAGFGVGLSWSALVMALGPLQACELIEFPESP